MNVYRLNAEISTILSCIDGDGEIPSQEIVDAIDRLNASIPERIDTLYKVLRTAVASATALRNEVQYTLGKARRWESIQEFIKESIINVLKALNVQSFETELCRPVICKGPPVVEVAEGFDPAYLLGTVYHDLVKQEITLRGDVIKAAAKVGEILPNGIQVIEGKPYLRIL